MRQSLFELAHRLILFAHFYGAQHEQARRSSSLRTTRTSAIWSKHITSSREGYDVAVVEDGEEGLRLVRKNDYDLVVLDLMLPGMNGLDVCRAIREDEKLRTTGILILTAKDDEADIVTGLELGADDYLVKPFNLRVLTARVRAVMRRLSDMPSNEDDTPLAIGPLEDRRAAPRSDRRIQESRSHSGRIPHSGKSRQTAGTRIDAQSTA